MQLVQYLCSDQVPCLWPTCALIKSQLEPPAARFLERRGAGLPCPSSSLCVFQQPDRQFGSTVNRCCGLTVRITHAVFWMPDGQMAVKLTE